jgi:hypothetical protein
MGLCGKPSVRSCGVSTENFLGSFFIVGVFGYLNMGRASESEVKHIEMPLSNLFG